MNLFSALYGCGEFASVLHRLMLSWDRGAIARWQPEYLSEELARWRVIIFVGEAGMVFPGRQSQRVYLPGISTMLGDGLTGPPNCRTENSALTRRQHSPDFALCGLVDRLSPR